MPNDDAIDQKQRADDNERLRNLAADEIASLRAEMSRMVTDRLDMKSGLVALAEQVSAQRAETERVLTELDETKAELAKATATVGQQQARITQLEKQKTRPLRLLAKKTLQRVGIKRGHGAG